MNLVLTKLDTHQTKRATYLQRRQLIKHHFLRVDDLDGILTAPAWAAELRRDAPPAHHLAAGLIRATDWILHYVCASATFERILRQLLVVGAHMIELDGLA